MARGGFTLLAIDDVALAVQLQELLEAAGYAVKWDAALANGPKPDTAGPVDLAVVGGSPETIDATARAWREREPPPAVLALGDERMRAAALSARVGFVLVDRAPEVIVEAAARALAVRFGQVLSPAHARGAIGLPPEATLASVVENKGHADIAVIQHALGPHKTDYVTQTAEVDKLRAVRALTIPEVDLTRRLDGTLTLMTALRATDMEPKAAARTLWALACVGAATLTAEPPDDATPERRQLRELRAHLRARQARLARATHYDVLEVTPKAELDEIDRAFQSAALRYDPSQFSGLDLGDAKPLAQTAWAQIQKARAVLSVWADRGRYNDWMAARMGSIQTAWAAAGVDPERAERAFAAGQRALVDGDAFRAVSQLALAARSHPGHPVYEATLAWAKYRAEVARGNDGRAVLREGRRLAEAALRGARPWPQALIALALMTAADGDPDTARYHVREALRADPSSPAAKQILARLGAGAAV